MRAAALWTLIRRDLVRVRGAMMTSGFGIAAGTAALVFFLALGLGVQSVLLGEVFPIDQIELELGSSHVLENTNQWPTFHW